MSLCDPKWGPIVVVNKEKITFNPSKNGDQH